jgi:hypothetical protein
MADPHSLSKNEQSVGALSPLYKSGGRDYLSFGKKTRGFPTVTTTNEISLATGNSASGGKQC